MDTIKRLVMAALVAVALAVGLGTVAASPAAANDNAYAKIWNSTNHTGSTAVGIGATFAHNWDSGTSYIVVNPGTWQGEISGNTAYEPRSFYVGPNWCVMYAFRLWGSPKGQDTWVCGGSTGVWTNIFFGPGNTYNYDVLLETAFNRGY
jgi:hypothetical protein